MALHLFDMQRVGLFEQNAGHVHKVLNIKMIHEVIVRPVYIESCACVVKDAVKCIVLSA